MGPTKSEKMQKFPGWKLLCVAIAVSIGGSFHFGYQLVITNPSQHGFMQFLNDSYDRHYHNPMSVATVNAVWSAIVAIFFVGAIPGALIISFVGNKVGRKRGLYVSTSGSITGVALSIISFFVVSFELYIISRVVLGIAVGLSLGLSALYLNESSPKECRGFVSMTTGIVVQIGTLIGSVIAMPSIFGTYHLWWCIYLVEIIMLIVIFCLLPLMPESPGYLTVSGRDDMARKSIKFFWACSDDEIEPILHEIKANMKEQAASMSLIEVLKNRIMRKGTIVGMTISFTMAFSGIAVINAYAVQILVETGLSLMMASIGNIILCAVSVVAILISALVVDRFGRRPLLLLANTAILISNLVIFVLMFLFDKFRYAWTGYTLVVVICLFIIFFAIGPGPLCYFVTAEMVGQEARASSQSWAYLMQMTGRTVLLAAYLPIVGAIGQAFTYLILFIMPVLIPLIFLYFNMPETKNMNLIEVLEEMDNLPSLSRFFRRRRTVHNTNE